MTEIGTLSDRRVRLFNAFVKQLRISLKNGQFYDPQHPLFIYSVGNLKTAIEKWIESEGPLEIAITPETLSPMGGGIPHLAHFADVAQNLHTCGLASLGFQAGITSEELTRFLTLLGQGPRKVIEQGGMTRCLTDCSHIRVKTLDYESLLHAAPPGSETVDEERIWRFLTELSGSQGGTLPEEKTEFLIEFFSDVDRSVRALNQIYREAILKAQDEKTVEQLKGAIVRICQFLEEKSKGEARELKVKLIQVISQLHPDLIQMLLSRTEEGEGHFDLVEAITQDFSESEIAEFIESLISNEDTFNENLLKVFDKLVPESQAAGPLVAMVADRLFAKRVVNPDALSKLQMSIREIFRRHPESNFMNQIYKITVDAVVNRKIDTLVYVARLSPLIQKFIQSIEYDRLKKEELWLLLNILWLENDAEEFRRFTSKILELLPELLDEKETERIKEIVEFFTEKTRPEQRRNEALQKAIHAGLARITNPHTLEHILAFVPEASRDDLENIAYIFRHSGNGAATTLVEAYLEEKERMVRNKLLFLILHQKEAIAEEVVRRFDYCEPEQARDLFLLLKHCEPGRAQLVARKLFNHPNPQIRFEALQVFQILNEEEGRVLFDFYKTEKHRGVQKQAARVILRSGDAKAIARLFGYGEKPFFRRKHLLELVELCGQLEVVLAEPHLKRLFMKKGFFRTRWRETLRIAALNSLSRLKKGDHKEILQMGLQDKNRRIREMSAIILKLEGR